MSSRRGMAPLRRSLDVRRRAERDITYRQYVRPAGRGLHVVRDPSNGQEIIVSSSAGSRTFRPGSMVPTGSQTAFPGEFILGLPPAEKQGASRSGFVFTQAREFGEVPVLEEAVIAYVGILWSEAAGLWARTYEADGTAIADVAGPWTDPGVSFGSTAAAFIRGATPASVAGCAVAFVLNDADVYILDVEGDAIVEPATDDRATLPTGGAWTVTLRAGSDGWWWEFGVAEGVSGEVDDDDANDFAYLRRISRDGSATDSVVASAPSPVNHGGPFNPDGRQSIFRGVFPVNATTWAAGYFNGELEEIHAITTVTESPVTLDVDNVTGDLNVSVGLVLGSSAGGALSRIVNLGPAGGYDGVYAEEPLFDLDGFTVQSVGTRRTEDALVVLVGEGATDTAAASRLCGYEGSHPITESAAGPAFERDDAAGEVLFWVFGV